MDTDVTETHAPAGAETGPDGAGPERAAEVTVDTVDRLLDEVEAALGRLDEGTYGTCTDCGGPIGDDRLAARPTVGTCGSCDAGVGGGDHADRIAGLSGAAIGDAPDDGAVAAVGPDEHAMADDLHDDDGITDEGPAGIDPAGHRDGAGPRPAPSPWSIRAFPDA